MLLSACAFVYTCTVTYARDFVYYVSCCACDFVYISRARSESACLYEQFLHFKAFGDVWVGKSAKKPLHLNDDEKRSSGGAGGLEHRDEAAEALLAKLAPLCVCQPQQCFFYVLL
jgi:hypothetical protein